jgi:hypothetical protein
MNKPRPKKLYHLSGQSNLAGWSHIESKKITKFKIGANKSLTLVYLLALSQFEKSYQEVILFHEDFQFFQYFIQPLLHLPPLFTVSEDAGIEHRTVATSALTFRHSNHSARSHPQLG